MSMAELIKGFHFYFLSNDHGLLYDVLDDDFQYTFLDPAAKFMIDHGAKIKLDTPVNEIQKMESLSTLRDCVLIAIDILVVVVLQVQISLV